MQKCLVEANWQTVDLQPNKPVVVAGVMLVSRDKRATVEVLVPKRIVEDRIDKTVQQVR